MNYLPNKRNTNPLTQGIDNFPLMLRTNFQFATFWNVNLFSWTVVKCIDEVLNINLWGSMVCAKEAAKYMVEHKYGRIITITSVIGLQGKSGFSEYAASKGGSIAFIKSLAQELGIFGITVNGVAPGIVQRGEVNKDMQERLSKTNWLGTYGKPEDISAVVNFLCREEASFITGQNIAVDEGRSLGLKEC